LALNSFSDDCNSLTTRSLTLLAGVIVAQVLLLAVQIKRERQVRLIRVWAVELISPLQRAASWSIMASSTAGAATSGCAARGKKTIALRAELDRLKVRNAELEGRALEADRLAALLNFRNAIPKFPCSPRACDRRKSGFRQPAGVYRPRFARRHSPRHGRDHARTAWSEKFSRFIRIFRRSCCWRQGKRRGRAAGGYAHAGPGKGNRRAAAFARLHQQRRKSSVGEAVLTSGQDRIFPEGSSRWHGGGSHPDRKSPFMKILVKPAAHLDRLEEVLVLLTGKIWN
jgi:hypothetical protein